MQDVKRWGVLTIGTGLGLLDLPTVRKRRTVNEPIPELAVSVDHESDGS